MNVLALFQKRVLDSLTKLKDRSDLKLEMPDEGCHAVGTHLAGMVLAENLDYFIKLVQADIRLSNLNITYV